MAMFSLRWAEGRRKRGERERGRKRERERGRERENKLVTEVREKL